MTKITSDTKEFYGQSFNDLLLSKHIILGKTFEDCIFQGCDFSEASLLKCEFTDCKFIQCNLSFLKVSGSQFSNIIFEKTKAIAIDWTKANWENVTFGSPLNFTHSQLNSSSFYGLSQTKIAITHCSIQDVDFREANLTEADFSDSDLSDSLFSNTNLSRANFDQAKNYDINLNNNLIKDARFSRYEAILLLESLDIELLD